MRRGHILCAGVAALGAALWVVGGDALLNVLLAVFLALAIAVLALFLYLQRVPAAAPPASDPKDVRQLREELQARMQRGLEALLDDGSLAQSSERQPRTPPVNQRITVLVDRFCKEYVDFWYKDISRGDTLFLGAIKSRLWVVINRLQERLQKIDMVNLLTQDCVAIITTHIRALQLYPRTSFPSHPCLISPVAEMMYLRRASEALVRVLLPETDLTSAIMRSLLRELVLRYVLKPTVDMWSDPDILNQTIIVNIDYFVKLDRSVERSYAYADTFAGFVKIISTTQDLNTLKDIRYHLITEIVQAKQIRELQVALKQGRADKLTYAMITDNPKALQLRSRNLDRYINQCAYAKSHCEERIGHLGGKVHDSDHHSPYLDPNGQGHGSSANGSATGSATGSAQGSATALSTSNASASVLDIINNGLSLGYFAEYLREKHALSNLTFWLACSHLRQEFNAQGFVSSSWRSSLQEMYRVAQAPNSNLQIQDKTLRELLATAERLRVSFPSNRLPRGNGGELQGFTDSLQDETVAPADIAPFLQAGEEVLTFFQQQYPPFLLSDAYRRYIRHALSSAERNHPPKNTQVGSPKDIDPSGGGSMSPGSSPRKQVQKDDPGSKPASHPQVNSASAQSITTTGSAISGHSADAADSRPLSVSPSTAPFERSLSISERLFGRHNFKREPSSKSMSGRLPSDSLSTSPPSSLAPSRQPSGQGLLDTQRTASPLHESSGGELSRAASPPLTAPRSVPSSPSLLEAHLASSPRHLSTEMQSPANLERLTASASPRSVFLAGGVSPSHAADSQLSTSPLPFSMSPLTSPSLLRRLSERGVDDLQPGVDGNNLDGGDFDGGDLDEFHDAEVGKSLAQPQGEDGEPRSGDTGGADPSLSASEANGSSEVSIHPLLRSKLDDISREMRQKMRELEVVRAEDGPESADERRRLVREIQSLEGEHEELQRHYESIQEWFDSIDDWQVDVQSVVTLPSSRKEDKGYSELMYGLLVHREKQVEGTYTTSRYGWVVYRKHSELQALHRHVFEYSSGLPKDPPFLAKAWGRFKPKSKVAAVEADCEKQKVSAQAYFSALMSDVHIRASQTLCSFLSRSPEHLRTRQEQAPTPPQKKRWSSFSKTKLVGASEAKPNGKKAAADDAAQTIDDEDAFLDMVSTGFSGRPSRKSEEQGGRSSAGLVEAAQIPQAVQRELEEEVLDEEGREARDSIARPMYALISEVFALRGVLTWLRRQLVTFVQLTYGSTINKSIVGLVDWLFYEPQLMYYLQIFHDSLFPENWRPPPPRSLAQKVVTRDEAQSKMLANIPDMLVTLVGQTNCRKGFVRLHEALQNTHTNKHLIYTLLETLLVAMCPEFGSRDLARATVEMDVGGDWGSEARS